MAHARPNPAWSCYQTSSTNHLRHLHRAVKTQRVTGIRREEQAHIRLTQTRTSHFKDRQPRPKLVRNVVCPKQDTPKGDLLLWAMSAPTAETGWQKLSQHKQPVHVWLLPRYYTNPVDSVPSPRHGSELHLPPLLAQKCIRASSPGCRHTTRCKTCLREDKAPAHTTAAYVIVQVDPPGLHAELIHNAASETKKSNEDTT